MPACPHCSAASTYKDGRDRVRKQRYRCSAYGRSFTNRTGTPFENHRWPRDVIVMAVRWYFCYRLSAANVRNLLAERGLDVSRQTVADWVQKFGILLAEAGRHHAKRVSSRWFVDETYVRVGKTWAYLYRAVDEPGQVVDVLLLEKRDVESAKAFFEQAIKRRGVVPKEVVTDKHRAYLRAVKQHAPNATHRRTGLHRKRALTTKPIERAHVPVKHRLRSMRGLRLCRNRAALAGGHRAGSSGAARRCPPTASTHIRLGSRALAVRGGDVLVATLGLRTAA